MHMEAFTHDAYKEACIEDGEFKEVFQQLQIQIHAGDGCITIYYNPQNELLYKLHNVTRTFVALGK